MSLLSSIIECKRHEVERRRRELSVEGLKSLPGYLAPRRPFEAALRSAARPIALIGEVKRASPSQGLLREDFDPAEIACQYERGGAACLSVLTDREFFQGADEHLCLAREATSLPVLRKDFVIQEYQVYESRALGADCILLIASIFAADRGRLAELFALAREEGLDVLVEVHNESELAVAAALGSTLIGVNNRDLATFEVDLATTERLASRAPAAAFIVSESGIWTREDVRRVAAVGVSGILVGESLVRQADIAAGVRELLGR